MLDELKESLFLILRKPLILLWGVSLWLAIAFLSFISSNIAAKLTTNFEQYLWLAFFSLLMLACLAIFLTGLSGYFSRHTSKSNQNYWRSTFNVFLVFLLIYVAYFILNTVAYYLSFALSSALSASVSAAGTIFYVVYMALLLGPIMFLTLAPFFASLSSSPWLSVRKSFSFVKSNYLKVLLCLVVFFVLGWLTSLLPYFVSSAVQTILLTPYFVLVFLSIISGK